MNKIMMNLTTDINIKGIMSLAGSTITYLIAGQEMAFVVLLVLAVIDGITGVVKASIRGEIHSTRFREKVWHYLAYCLVIIAMNQVLHITPYMGFLVDFVVFYFAAGEIISIMENLEEAGVPMPTYVKNKLLDMSKRKEAKYRREVPIYPEDYEGR